MPSCHTLAPQQPSKSTFSKREVAPASLTNEAQDTITTTTTTQAPYFLEDLTSNSTEPNFSFSFPSSFGISLFSAGIYIYRQLTLGSCCSLSGTRRGTWTLSIYLSPPRRCPRARRGQLNTENRRRSTFFCPVEPVSLPAKRKLPRWAALTTATERRRQRDWGPLRTAAWVYLRKVTASVPSLSLLSLHITARYIVITTTQTVTTASFEISGWAQPPNSPDHRIFQVSD